MFKTFNNALIKFYILRKNNEKSNQLTTTLLGINECMYLFRWDMPLKNFCLLTMQQYRRYASIVKDVVMLIDYNIKVSICVPIFRYNGVKKEKIDHYNYNFVYIPQHSTNHGHFICYNDDKNTYYNYMPHPSIDGIANM